MSAWRLTMPRGVSGTPPAVQPFAPSLGPNWWQNWQYGGTNPSVVLDFANGVYWNGIATLTSPSTLVSGGTVTAGSGLHGATGVTASGALLTAMKATAFNAQLNTVAGSASSNLGLWAEDIGGPNGVLTNTGTGLSTVFAYPTNLSPGSGADFSKSNWVNYSQSSGVRRISLVGPGNGTTSAAGTAAADTNNYATPNTVFLGSWNSGFPFDGYLSSFAVLPAALPNKVIPPRAFTGGNGWWWNGDATNSGISYGTILQYEWTQPWTIVAGICCLNANGASPGVANVTGIIFTTVPDGSLNPAFPGREFWLGSAAVLVVRIIHINGTNLIGKFGSTTLADGKLHFVVATYDGSGLAAGVNLYIDAILETMSIESDTLGGLSIINSGSGGNPYVIGNQTAESFGMPGAIGFYREYNRVLSLGEIRNFQINQILPPIDSSCVLAPKLNEGGSSTTTGDFSASGFTGTMANANQWLRG